MAVLTTASVDHARIVEAFDKPGRITVVSLCAAWCDTCNEFRADYATLAEARPDVTFVWLDIEDDAEVVGDADVENFPTIAIFRGGDPLHYGVSLPHASSIGRLVDALAAAGAATSGHAPDAVRELPERLRRHGDDA